MLQEDAVEAAELLSIALPPPDKSSPTPIPLVRVPITPPLTTLRNFSMPAEPSPSANKWRIPNLPSRSSAAEVVRLYTPGTLIDSESFLPANRTCWPRLRRISLRAETSRKELSLGLATLDVSTGREYWISEFDGAQAQTTLLDSSHDSSRKNC